MAKKSSAPSTTWRDIIAGAKAGKAAPVTILMGEESYYIDLITEAFERHFIPEGDRDFNQLILYGADTDIETVVSGAQQYPFMSDRRLVILKEAQSMERAKQQLDKLEGYVKHPNTSTALVIVYKAEPLGATSKLIKAASKGLAVIYTSNPLKEYQVASPVRDYCREKGVGIDEKAIEMLVVFAGNSLSKLFGEIDKLTVAGGADMKRITPDMVEKNIGFSKEYNNFELVKALSFKDYASAMRIVSNFASNPRQNPTVVTVGMIFNFFSKVCIAHFNPDKSDSALMGVLKLRNSYALDEVRRGMAAYNPAQAVKAISAIREMDAKSKGIDSTQNEHDLLRELIFRLMIV
ncbi:MAG: DNA polymerase III subunit delta [Muribaculaceae bacterium]|nr:DNA polymerase III subunit delta [Muribaculaceae bacterium]